MPGPGDIIGGYTLREKLGSGGFGEVWLAEKESQLLTKKVAVKLPLETQVNFDAIRQEATLWEQASGHPNVLPIIDADILDGQVLIVSEYADGGSLADKIAKEGHLPVKEAVEMTIGVLSGLGYLHSKGIVHRDIKPQNILLQGNTARLADFGISRALQSTAASSTIAGTDAYMSPEAFDGKRSEQTDIWSVGVVLYQLLEGTLPFPQQHPSERLFAVLTKDFQPLSTRIPSPFCEIVAKALEKLPENRYRASTEMRDELRSFLVSLEQKRGRRRKASNVDLPQRQPPSPNQASEIVTREKMADEISRKEDPVEKRPPTGTHFDFVRVEVSGRQFHFPPQCVCCGRRADQKFTVSASRTTGKKVVKTSTKSWDFPYCSTCVDHVNANQPVGCFPALGFFLFAGVLSLATAVFFPTSPNVLLAGFITALIGGSALALLLFRLQKRLTEEAVAEAQRKCRPECVCLSAAVKFLDWDGTRQIFAIASPAYAVDFMIANQRKLINVGPRAQRLLEKHGHGQDFGKPQAARRYQT